MKKPLTLGIVGVRGYVGRELMALLAERDDLIVDWVSSRQLAGQNFAHLMQADSDFKLPSDLNNKDHYYFTKQIEHLSSEQVAERVTDIIVLALPNGLAADYVAAIQLAKQARLVIDLSADYRFDQDWIYLLSETANKKTLTRLKQQSLIKISNPGCYATAMQLAIAPLTEFLSGAVHCFGVSGYSGAGTTPSDNNNPDKLKDNIRPYALLGHLHEKEVATHTDSEIRFSPHVASFFRGICMTLQIQLKQSLAESQVLEIYSDYYQQAAMVQVQQTMPFIPQVVHQPIAIVGGFKLDETGTKLGLVCCLDNLMKGAASQALQNICLAMDIEFKQQEH